MVIRVLDFVNHAYTADDGIAISKIVRSSIVNTGSATVSFDGVDSVTSSFVNAAFVVLLDEFRFDEIKRLMKIVDSTKQINTMVKQRLSSEAEKRIAASV